AVGPQPFPELFTADWFAWMFEQVRENLEGLVGEPNLQSVLPQFTRSKVEIESAETNRLAARALLFHEAPLVRNYKSNPIEEATRAPSAADRRVLQIFCANGCLEASNEFPEMGQRRTGTITYGVSRSRSG